MGTRVYTPEYCSTRVVRTRDSSTLCAGTILKYIAPASRHDHCSHRHASGASVSGLLDHDKAGLLCQNTDPSFSLVPLKRVRSGVSARQLRIALSSVAFPGPTRTKENCLLTLARIQQLTKEP